MFTIIHEEKRVLSVKQGTRNLCSARNNPSQSHTASHSGLVRTFTRLSSLSQIKEPQLRTGTHKTKLIAWREVNRQEACQCVAIEKIPVSSHYYYIAMLHTRYFPKMYEATVTMIHKSENTDAELENYSLVSLLKYREIHRKE